MPFFITQRERVMTFAEGEMRLSSVPRQTREPYRGILPQAQYKHRTHGAFARRGVRADAVMWREKYVILH